MRVPPLVGRPVTYALFDAILLALSWAIVYKHRFAALPAFSPGPVALVSVWLVTQYLLGTYISLSRRHLDFGRHLRNCFFSSCAVISMAAASTLLRGDPWTSTINRGFLIAVLALGFFSNQILRLSYLSSHLWQPQETWLFLVSTAERSVISRAIDDGGCAIPCGIEWRTSSGLASLPAKLPSLLELDGVVVGTQHQPSAADRATLLAWQEQGLRLSSLPAWSEAFLHRLPPELLPQTWAERVEVFSNARSGPALRLKRLGDLLLSTLILGLCSPLFLVIWHYISTDLCNGRYGKTFRRLRFVGSGFFSALPQLINVWRGEMSLVGPRPFSAAAMHQLELRFPGAELRQWMRPGMTGWGRISGPPPQEPDAVAWELGRDLYYLRNHSLLLDLRLLLTSFVQLILSAPWRP